MKNLLACLALLCLFGTLEAQTLKIRAPRISNWQLDDGLAKDVELWITPGATFIQLDIDVTISAAQTYFRATDTLEAVLNFAIPDGAFITDSWLWIGDDIIKARIQDRWSAEETFENIVDRNLDPSILTKVFGNSYELKVFPMTKNWDRKVRITLVLPATLSNGSLSSIFPRNLLPPEQINQAAISVKIRHTEPFGVPKLGTAIFDIKDNYLVADLPRSSLHTIPTIQFLLPATDYLLQTYATATDAYYGLNIDTEKFMSKANTVQHFMLIVDYFSANNREDLKEIALAIGEKLRTSFKPTDAISLYCGNPEQPLLWVNADDDGIEKITQKISGYDGFSQLPDILVEGVALAQINEVDQIFFLSNSNPGWSVQQTALALERVDEANLNNIPIYSVGFQNTNWVNRNINGQNYANNNYFLELLARDHNGNHEYLNRNEGLAERNLTAFDNRGVFPNNRVLNVQVSEGTTFENISLTDNAIVGRYFGKNAFQVSLIDIANQRLDTVVTLLENTESINYPVLQQWTGHQLDELTGRINSGYYSNVFQQEIFDVIELSLENRVLSTYTALLALEPALGGKVCLDCAVEKAGGVIDKDFVFNSLGLDVDVAEEVITNSDDFNNVNWEVLIGPNPTRDFVFIEITDIDVPIDQFVAELYDMQGKQLIRQVGYAGQLTIDIQHLDAGIYFLHIWVNNQKIVRKLIVLK